MCVSTKMTMNKISIVILTESSLLKNSLVTKIEADGRYVIKSIFNDGSLCEQYFIYNTCDLLIVDLLLSNIDGVGVISRIKANNNSIKHIICISDFINTFIFDLLEGLSIDYCVKKPVDLGYFMEIIERIVKVQIKQNSMINDYRELSLKKGINDIFMKVGLPRHLKGYNYLVTAIILVCGNINLLGEITKELYPQIARIHGTTASRVEQAIRHVLKCTWQSGCQRELEQLFGSRINKKVCNSEFISTVAGEMLEKYM